MYRVDPIRQAITFVSLLKFQCGITCRLPAKHCCSVLCYETVLDLAGCGNELGPCSILFKLHRLISIRLLQMLLVELNCSPRTRAESATSVLGPQYFEQGFWDISQYEQNKEH